METVIAIQGKAKGNTLRSLNSIIIRVQEINRVIVMIINMEESHINKTGEVSLPSKEIGQDNLIMTDQIVVVSILSKKRLLNRKKKDTLSQG
jgi:hypothetical protein